MHDHGNHAHVHAGGDRPHAHPEGSAGRPTFWVLFTIFVLGPCEPLIPLFILPASRGLWGVALLTASVFGVVTLGTMLVLTLAAHRGLRAVRIEGLERWMHALCGAVIAASGGAIVGLGL